MPDSQSPIGALFTLIAQTGVALGAMLTDLNLGLRHRLEQMGMPYSLQIGLPLVVTVLLILGSVRVLDGFLRIFVLLLLLAIAYDIALPFGQS